MHIFSLSLNKCAVVHTVSSWRHCERIKVSESILRLVMGKVFERPDSFGLKESGQ